MEFPQVAGRQLTWAARQYGARAALIHGERSYSYAEVDARTNRFAHALVALRLAPGERIAALLNNCVDSVISVFGAEKAAQTYVALNARHTLAEHVGILEDAQASTLVLGPEFAALAGPLQAAVPSLRHVIGVGFTASGALDYEALLAAASEQAPAISIGAEHIVRIGYTSGTTGKPKGVVYTAERWQERLNNQFIAMEHALGINDAMLHVGPLTHAAGVYLLPCLLRGARNVIADRFDAAALLRDVERHRITHLMLVPTMLARVVDALDAGVRADLSSLRIINYGTAPASLALLERALAHFGPILRQQYGMTEAVQPLAVLYPLEHLTDATPQQANRLRSCGKPTVNVTITIRGADGRELPPGEIGEIAIAHQGLGAVQFWRQPEITAQSIRDGWYYSGDLGHFDADGYLYIVGRNKEMIISGGFNVYAREVEEALATHPAVAESAVLGIPDAEWGEIVAAFVIVRPHAEVTPDELAAHCGQRIAGYKKPRLIRLVDELPRNNAGKVTKHALRDQFLAAAASAETTS
ncbi:MAG TPA: AMP-binding protein [Burkholderiaceae bacterium]|nr:AMP-binding protein [Burkholderiaceae bacterium]